MLSNKQTRSHSSSHRDIQQKLDEAKSERHYHTIVIRRPSVDPELVSERKIQKQQEADKKETHWKPRLETVVDATEEKTPRPGREG